MIGNNILYCTVSLIKQGIINTDLTYQRYSI